MNVGEDRKFGDSVAWNRNIREVLQGWDGVQRRIHYTWNGMGWEHIEGYLMGWKFSGTQLLYFPAHRNLISDTYDTVSVKIK